MIALLTGMLLQKPTIEADIVYSKVAGKEMKLDAYQPATPNGRVFIVLHGGEFTGGTKGKQTGLICSFLMRRGFTCFDVDYRIQDKPKESSLPKALTEALDDVNSAYTWVQKNASKYGGNPNKVSIGGISAGAVAAMYSVYHRKLVVKSVVDLWGSMFGTESDIRKGAPPLLIVHGKRDKVIPYYLGKALANQCRNNSVVYRMLENDLGHDMSLNTEIGHYSILEHIDTFLRETS